MERFFPTARAVIPVPAAITTPSFSIAAAQALTESLQIQSSFTFVFARTVLAISPYCLSSAGSVATAKTARSIVPPTSPAKSIIKLAK